jgi:hypothetical protein
MLYVLDVSNNAVYIIDPFYHNLKRKTSLKAQQNLKRKESSPSHANNEPRSSSTCRCPAWMI